MKLANLVPNFFKPLLKPIYRVLVQAYWKVIYRSKYREKIHQYWKHPWDGLNLPEHYLEGKPRSQFLVQIIKQYIKPNGRILEIGCNVGRNLNHLFHAGFRELIGIEISENAVQLLKKSYPEMARHAKIYNVLIEEVVRDFHDAEFDVVFTMAVLEHIHPSNEWIFPEIVRITKDLLITIEDEGELSWKHFPRNYQKIFEPLGMKQIKAIHCSDVKGLSESFFARIFRKG